ncbi:MAG: FecR family protein [Candidatus Omnitrophica bacterium]|nr:FecR family protein [Candidatus Omnitrophota bacterium]
MTRKLILSCICLLFSFSAFAQTAKIIDVKGDVSVKKGPAASWEKAATNTFLEALAEIKTGKDSKCTLIFDDQMKNILTVRENSQITLTEIKPVNISLPQGRVFALIDDIKKVEKFEIRTPTAVAGVRGTGESVEFNNGVSIIQCLQSVVNVQGLDSSGLLQKALDLLAGLGVTVDADGNLSASFQLSAEDLKAWQDFMDYIEDLRGSEDGNGSTDDLRQDQQQDYKDNLFEGARRDEEGRPRDEGGSGGSDKGDEGGEGGYDYGW